MDLRRVGFQGRDGIGHKGQHVVLDPHQRSGAAGGVEIVGGNGGHLVAGEAHAGVQHEHVRGQAGIGHIEGSDGGADAGQRQGLA